MVADPGVPAGVIDVSANVRASGAGSNGTACVTTVSGLIRSKNVVVDVRMEEA